MPVNAWKSSANALYLLGLLRSSFSVRAAWVRRSKRMRNCFLEKTPFAFPVGDGWGEPGMAGEEGDW